MYQQRCMLSLCPSMACSVVGFQVWAGACQVLAGVARYQGFYRQGCPVACLPGRRNLLSFRVSLVGDPVLPHPTPCLWCACFMRACCCLLPLLGAGVHIP